MSAPPEPFQTIRPPGPLVAAVIRTELGDIGIELHPRRAPASCSTFLRYVDAGAFRGTSFYRAARADNEFLPDAPAQLIQGGVSVDGATLFPPAEHEPSTLTGLEPVAGALGLGRDEPGTAGSEFFINVVDNPALREGGGRGDGLGVAILGRVTCGMDIVRAIHGGETRAMRGPPTFAGQMLRRPVRIIDIARQVASLGANV